MAHFACAKRDGNRWAGDGGAEICFGFFLVIASSIGHFPADSRYETSKNIVVSK